MNEVFLDVEVETPEGPLEIRVWRSERDGAVVASIDTPDWEDGYDGPDMRLWLNSALLHHGEEEGLEPTLESELIPDPELTTTQELAISKWANMLFGVSKLQSKHMGTLEERYNIYVEAVTAMGWTPKTFDEWLDS